MAKVDIRNLEKAFGDTRVLKGINLDIEDGRFVVLVGPSGCGKSTLLRVIAGLEDPTGGAVLIGDIDVTDLHPKDRDIAMVFQNYGLYPHMTVRENMGYALKLKRVDRIEIDRLVEQAAGILNLDELLDRLPRQLSGGQRQRVAMGRAIVRDPKVFLFDEPLSNLDAKLRVQMRVEIRRLHQRLGVTTVYVTHDQIEAMTMADTIVAMQDGVVMQTGSPLELYDHPANIFVAGFIGSPAMNLFKASVRDAGLELADGAVLPSMDLDVTSGQAVIAGVRPEDLLLAEHGVPARVALAEHTGSEIHVTASLGEQGDGDDVTILVRERTELHPGQSVRLAPRPGHVHLFDPTTQNRLDGS